MFDLYEMAQRCAPGVEPTTMLKIIGVESGQKEFAIGYKITNGSKVYLLTYQPKTLTEAKSWAKWLLENGYRFDAGISQVNSANWSRFGLTPENIFDPCTNINAAGKILIEFYVSAVKKFGEGQQALNAAISGYQSGNFVTGNINGYVEKVRSKKIPERNSKIIETMPSIELVETIALENYQ